MVSIDPQKQSERDNYKLLTGSIIPRPVAWVSTLAENGKVNAAPFSYFNIVTADPPMISVSVQRKEGVPKDTARNAMREGAFVVHIGDESSIEKLNRTAASLPPDQSEVELAGLTAIASEVVHVPGIAEAKIRLECTLERSIPLGGSQGLPGTDLLIGRVVRFHVEDAVLDHGRVLADVLQPVSRLAGSSYAKLGETFSLERPQ
ncbi:flavin reductase family protein [Paenibacillus sp. HJL G12]|uniref:Flavin reductase family protein n=1 Tax=Paenibacillus dendrobii TaxID=2691084 RepID=A0A7X3IIE7_9BACL|nr:flavin reductase family protein [Paenibacillus dendrobii]MWV44484.1 flavin reductase family protein [Paenibacillus dendrobii]